MDSKTTKENPNMFFESFKSSQNAKNLYKRFSVKNYCQSHQWLKNICLVFSYLANLVSIAAAFYGLYSLFLFIVPITPLAAAFSLTILVLLEIAQRKSSDQLWDEYVRDAKINYLWATLSICLFVASAFSSGYGTYIGVKDQSQPIALKKDSTLLSMESQLATINANIETAKKTKWRGTVTTRSQDAIKQFSKSHSAITGQLLAYTQKLQNENEQENAKAAIDIENIALTTLLLYLLIALLFEASLYYCSYFDFRFLCEKFENNPEQLKVLLKNDTPISMPQIHTMAPAAKREIGFRKSSNDNHLPTPGSKSSFDLTDEPPPAFVFDFKNIVATKPTIVSEPEHIKETLHNQTELLKRLIKDIQADKGNLKNGHGKKQTVLSRLATKFDKAYSLDFSNIPTDLQEKLNNLKTEIEQLRT